MLTSVQVLPFQSGAILAEETFEAVHSHSVALRS